jgi:nitrite reductase/ring-hydroxylating ferredoxin subunit
VNAQTPAPADANGWTPLLDVSQLPEGKGLAAHVGEHSIALFRVGEQVHALGEQCSHEAASLAEGQVLEGRCVECPMHGARFDLRTGRALCLPAVRPVKVYPVRVTQGRVEVKLN